MTALACCALIALGWACGRMYRRAEIQELEGRLKESTADVRLWRGLHQAVLARQRQRELHRVSTLYVADGVDPVEALLASTSPRRTA